MGKRTFELHLEGIAILELDDAVIDAVDDEWRSQLYNLETPEEIAQMIGANLIAGLSLSDLDGWADQPNKNARIIEDPDWDIDVEETTP